MPRPIFTVAANQHIKNDGFLYHGPSQHTSMVVNIQGNVVHTVNGTVYYLLDVDSEIGLVMSLLVSIPRGPFTVSPSTGDAYPPWNPLDPINPRHVPLLFLAERIVYGDLSPRKAGIVAAMEGMRDTAMWGVLDSYAT